MEALSHKERVLCAIAHRKPDLLPMQFDFSGGTWDKLKRTMGFASVDEGIRYFDNHIIYAYFGDTLGAMRSTARFSEPMIYDEFGTGFDTSQEGICVMHSPLQDIDDYTRYEFPDPNAPHLLTDAARATIAANRDEYIVTTNHILCLFERAWAIRGLENFLCDLMENEDFACELLDKITDYQIALAKRMIALGVNCGRTSDDYGCQNGMLISPGLWRKIVKPRIARIWNVYRDAGLPVIHHSCGDIRPIIPDLIECGVNILNDIQSECMPREELAERYGDKLCFYGGLSAQNILVYGTPEQVRKDVREAVETLGRNNGYIISPGVTLTSDVPQENIAAMLEAARRYRARQ